jgi:hypothetical protein
VRYGQGHDPLARRGFRITCVEIGAELAAAARQNLAEFSGHIAMEPWKRDRLYGEIRRRLADRADGRLRRHWGAVLHVARRRSSVPAGHD